MSVEAVGADIVRNNFGWLVRTKPGGGWFANVFDATFLENPANPAAKAARAESNASPEEALLLAWRKMRPTPGSEVPETRQ